MPYIPLLLNNLFKLFWCVPDEELGEDDADDESAETIVPPLFVRDVEEFDRGDAEDGSGVDILLLLKSLFSLFTFEITVVFGLSIPIAGVLMFSFVSVSITPVVCKIKCWWLNINKYLSYTRDKYNMEN